MVITHLIPGQLFLWIFRVRKLHTNLFCSQTFRAPPGYPGKNPRISRQKVWFPRVLKDIPNFLAPTPAGGRPPAHPKISGPAKSFGLGSVFFPDFRKKKKDRGLPLPLGRGVCETESKKGRARDKKPFIHRVYSARREIETMVSDHGLGKDFCVGVCAIGSKETNKQKTHKHFSDGPCGTIVPGTNPHPSQGQTGQNGDFTVELNRERPVCPRDGSHFVPGRGPICPKDGSCLSRTLSCRKCLCLLVFFSCPMQWTLQ